MFVPKFMKFSLIAFAKEFPSCYDSLSMSFDTNDTIVLPLFSTRHVMSFSAGGKMGRRRTQTLIDSLTNVGGEKSFVDFTDLAGEITPLRYAVAEFRSLVLFSCCRPYRDLDRYLLFLLGEEGYYNYYYK